MNVILFFCARVLRAAAIVTVFALSVCPARFAAAQGGVVIETGLVLRGADWYASAGHVDPVELGMIHGNWATPRVDQVVRFDDGEHRWQALVADEEGWLAHDDVAGGYIYVTVESPTDRVVILEAMAHRMVYVNGEARAGNLYQYKESFESWEPHFNYSHIPVRLRAGTNDLLFQGGRSNRIKVRIHEPAADVMINTRDLTAPDLLIGEAIDHWMAVPLINATTEAMDGLAVTASIGDGETVRTEIPTLHPLSVFKSPFKIEGPAPALPGERAVTLTVTRSRGGGAKIVDEQQIVLNIKKQDENHKRTFVSDIDGSVQYFSLNPSQGDDTTAALFLSVHGAAVEAINQSGSYKAKSWGHIVAPTNRRPYGFNWEDWGRKDALEVMEIAMSTLGIDPRRVYLTGHSMGGHGAWHIGSLYPDRFAALGPSAGWISFWTYRPGRDMTGDTDMASMLMRATLPSHTMDFVENYHDLGIYVLHGADDDNVPATEARLMVERLQGFHKDFIYHEEAQAGHWWDKSDEDGADCVDWLPMFDFFAHHAVPDNSQIRRVRFKTPSPGVSAKYRWVSVDAQQKQLEPSSVDIRFDPGKRRFVGSTVNVARMTIDLSHIDPSGPLRFEVDGISFDMDYPSQRASLTFQKTDGQWIDTPPALPTTKGPARYGTFKDLFDNRVILVFGTNGTEEENAWAFGKARFDAESFWYQANGAIEVVRDVNFDPRGEPDRNVVLYGNEKTNKAWSVLGKDPVRVRPNEVRIRKKKIKGKDLGVLLIRPRRGSDVACVGVVGGTGIEGMRLTDRRPYLYPGFAYPDLTVFCPPSRATEMGIVCGAGFFGLDWRVESGEFVWLGRAD